MREIAKKYHISSSVYSEIKNSTTDKTINKETKNIDEPPKKETIKNKEPVNVKTTKNTGISKAGIMNEEHTNKEAKNNNIHYIKPSPKIKTNKFLFPRIGKKNTFLITYLADSILNSYCTISQRKCRTSLQSLLQIQ